MKNLFLAFAVMCITQVQAQVGIGIATPHASSQLDITSTEKGILIPRMNEIQRTGIISPATGLLVYQTDGAAGFYVYKGSAWTQLMDNAGNYLLLSGGTLTGALSGTTAGFTGAVGIGTSAQTAAGAGAGALRYNTASGGIIQYSNGVSWNTLTSTVQRSLVTGYFSGTYPNSYYGNLTCTETDDVNGDFAANSFTVPRTGYYTFTFTGSTNGGADVNLRGAWEIQVVPSSGSSYVSRFYCPAAITAYIIGVSGAYSVRLTAGTTVTFKLFQSTGYSQTLTTPHYCQFSIVEN